MSELDEQNKALIESLVSLGVLETGRIIDAFLDVPRHLFVPKRYLSRAYDDVALPSLGGQTISQPYTVATMLEALSPDPGDNVLDIGSGTGWTTCLLGSIVGKKGKITGIELDPELYEFAKKNITKVNVENIELVLGDARRGYPKNATYHCVLINAACDSVPEDVKDQTKMGGRIVAPINANGNQKMILFQKVGDDRFTETNLGNFVFVRLK